MENLLHLEKASTLDFIKIKTVEPHRHGYKAITSLDKPELYKAFQQTLYMPPKKKKKIGTLTLCLNQALLIPTTLKSYLIKSNPTKTKTFFCFVFFVCLFVFSFLFF